MSAVEFKIRLADKNIAVISNFPTTKSFCAKYAAPESTLCDFKVDITLADIQKEREKSYAEDDFEGKARREFSDEYLETLALYRKISDNMCDHGVILFHGSVISVDGEAFLFTAKSGTGKSTHTRLWRELFGERAVMVNDDKPLIALKDNGEVLVYGTPWCGKHSLGSNISAPLSSICILERAAQNTITKVAVADVYPLLIQQTYRSSDPMKLMKTLPLLDSLLKKISVYRLGCNMDIEAAKVAYTAMSGKNI